jgi:hypothetical protein
VLYVSDFGLVAGLRHTKTDAWYQRSDVSDDGEPLPAADNGPMHRLGPFLAYTLFSDPGAAFDRPTALIIVNWWLTHRYRTGEDVSQAIPYVVAGFTFYGDLWRSGD